MLYDLHVHTTASDGLWTPGEVLEKAAQIGLLGIAITDHDTVDGLAIAWEYFTQHKIDLEFIPGIEMNTEWDGEEVHILGYFIDYHNKALIKRLAEIQAARSERARKMVDKLTKLGLSINFEQVQRLAGGDLIGRPHIARALIEKSHVFSVKEAFEKYIGKNKPAYVPRYKFLPQEAINLIKQAGGISILAHPGLINNQSKVEAIINLGIEGIEVFYPEHTPQQIKEYLDLSIIANLLVTGGSDFHGTGSAESRAGLGDAGINQDMMEKLYNRYNAKKCIKK